MKKIGFVDLYISEWHANNYPAWIDEAVKEMGADCKVTYAWAKEEVSPVDGRTTDQLCEAFGIEKCETVEELCEKSDYIVLLAPSNPEAHLELAEKVLPFGKPTYIDKTFAPDLATAEKIFALAEKYGTPFFSTSALRYAEELTEFKGVKNLFLTGGGRNLPEYIIHPIEMAVSLLGGAFNRVKCEPMGQQVYIKAEGEENQLVIMFSPAFGYSLSGEFPDGNVKKQDVNSAFFANLIRDMLKFFEDRKPPFNTGETLEVMRLRDGVLKAEATPDTWINL